MGVGLQKEKFPLKVEIQYSIVYWKMVIKPNLLIWFLKKLQPKKKHTKALI